MTILLRVERLRFLKTRLHSLPNEADARLTRRWTSAVRSHVEVAMHPRYVNCSVRPSWSSLMKKVGWWRRRIWWEVKDFRFLELTTNPARGYTEEIASSCRCSQSGVCLGRDTSFAHAGRKWRRFLLLSLHAKVDIKKTAIQACTWWECRLQLRCCDGSESHCHKEEVENNRF